MHISEGMLSSQMLTAGWAIAGVGTAIGLKKLEYEQYKNIRRQMPKPGKTLDLGGVSWTVLQQHPLTETLTISGPDDTHKSVDRAEWQNADANAPPEDSKTGMAPAAGPPAKC